MINSFSFSRLSLAFTKASHLPDSEWAGEYRDGYWLISCKTKTESVLQCTTWKMYVMVKSLTNAHFNPEYK